VSMGEIGVFRGVAGGEGEARVDLSDADWIWELLWV
jgi:hypothetical protein